MLLVIFGAGASYDSVYPTDLPLDQRKLPVGGGTNVPAVLADWKHPHRPPQSDGLVSLRDHFGKIVDRWGSVRSLLARLRRTFEAGGPVNIEAELDGMLSEAESAPHLLRELAAFRFYLRDIIEETCWTWFGHAHGVTNYHSLLRRIESWRHRYDQRVLLVTFNYDTLLEQAAADVLGLRIGGLADYVGLEDSKWMILKPHGSVNWGRYLRDDSPVRDSGLPTEHALIDRAAEIEPTNDYLWLGNRGGEVLRDGRVLLPALAIPTTTKADFECPADHIARLKHLLPDVRRVMVIGWRATEEHFLQRILRGGLKNPIQIVAVVNGGVDFARDAAGRLEGATSLPSDRFEPTKLGFSTLLDGKDEGETILEQVLAAVE